MTVLGQDPGSVMFQSGAARRHLCGHFVDELSIHPFAEGGGDAVYRKAHKCIQHAFARGK
jgi:hypothetical protein